MQQLDLELYASIGALHVMYVCSNTNRVHKSIFYVGQPINCLVSEKNDFFFFFFKQVSDKSNKYYTFALSDSIQRGINVNAFQYCK